MNQLVEAAPDRTNVLLKYIPPRLLLFGQLSSTTMAGAGTVAEVNPVAGMSQGACVGLGAATNMMRYPCS